MQRAPKAARCCLWTCPANRRTTHPSRAVTTAVHAPTGWLSQCLWSFHGPSKKHSMLFKLWKPLPAAGKKGGLFDTKSFQTVSWKMHKLTNPSCWNLAKPLYNKTNCYSQCLKTIITVITHQKNNTDNHKLQVPNFPKSWGSKKIYIDADAVTSPLANTNIYSYNIYIYIIYTCIHNIHIWQISGILHVLLLDPFNEKLEYGSFSRVFCFNLVQMGWVSCPKRSLAKLPALATPMSHPEGI